MKKHTPVEPHSNWKRSTALYQTFASRSKAIQCWWALWHQYPERSSFQAPNTWLTEWLKEMMKSKQILPRLQPQHIWPQELASTYSGQGTVCSYQTPNKTGGNIVSTPGPHSMHRRGKCKAFPFHRDTPFRRMDTLRLQNTNLIASHRRIKAKSHPRTQDSLLAGVCQGRSNWNLLISGDSACTRSQTCHNFQFHIDSFLWKVHWRVDWSCFRWENQDNGCTLFHFQESTKTGSPKPFEMDAD